MNAVLVAVIREKRQTLVILNGDAVLWNVHIYQCPDIFKLNNKLKVFLVVCVVIKKI